jgi:hypothetical protein
MRFIDGYLSKFNQGNLQYNDAVLMLLTASLKGITKNEDDDDRDEDDDDNDEDDDDDEEIVTKTEEKIEERIKTVLPFLCDCLINPSSIIVNTPSIIDSSIFQLTCIYCIEGITAKGCDCIYMLLPQIINVLLSCLSLPVSSDNPVNEEILFNSLTCIYQVADKIECEEVEEEEEKEVGMFEESSNKPQPKEMSPLEIKKKQKMEILKQYLQPLFQKLLSTSLRKECEDYVIKGSLTTAQRLVEVGLPLLIYNFIVIC